MASVASVEVVAKDDCIEKHDEPFTVPIQVGGAHLEFNEQTGECYEIVLDGSACDYVITSDSPEDEVHLRFVGIYNSGNGVFFRVHEGKPSKDELIEKLYSLLINKMDIS